MGRVYLKIPHKIHLDKARARRDYRLYGVFSVVSLYGFWYGTENFFLEAGINILLLFLMLLCFIFLLRETVKQYNQASDSNPVLALTEEGVQFFHKDYAGIGIIPWTEILDCREVGNPYFVTTLCVNVRTPLLYLDLIGGKKRKKLMKFNDKNGTQSIFNIEAVVLDADLEALKKTVEKMVEKNANKIVLYRTGATAF